MSEEQIRIILIDDHAAMREPLSTLLDARDDCTVVGQAGSLTEAIALVFGDTRADVFVIDLDLGDGDGRDLIRMIRKQGLPGEILVLTSNQDDSTLGEAIAVGAGSVLVKTASTSRIVETIRHLAHGEPVMPPQEMVRLIQAWENTRTTRLPQQRLIDTLSGREREVLIALAEGLSDKDLADRLHISVKTAHTHVSNILTKLGCDSRLQAVLIAIRNGLANIS